jgi:CRP/FNR family transcriptional regulator
MAKVSKPESCLRCPYKWKYLNLLDDEDITSIQSSCTIINFKKGETICKQGTDATHALYLAKGKVKLYIEGKKNLILKLITAGEYIDLQTLFGDKTYKYSVAAMEDTMVCMINSEILQDLAKKNSDYLFELTKTISDSGNYVYKKISDLSRKQLRGRLADTILYLRDEIFYSDEFDMGMTRKELAELSSMSMENAVRILSEFKKDNIISLEGKRIKILQLDILKKLSDIG